MAALCNVAARVTAAPKVAARAASKVQARAFLGRVAPLKAKVAGACHGPKERSPVWSPEEEARMHSR